MEKSEGSARDEAIVWHLQLDHADETEWDELVAWLESDPQHRLEFDRAELAGADVTDAAWVVDGADIPLSRPRSTLRRRRWPLIGGFGAVAASLVAALTLIPQQSPSSDFATTETRPGEQRNLTLPDGSRLYLNGATRVLIDRKGYRLVRLERGEVTFDVRHDPARPFTVALGASRLQDVGTIFNVRLDGSESRVGVQKGAVVFNPDRENLTLTRGAILTLDAGKRRAVLGAADPGDIGSWRRGALIYERESLRNVAADLTRTLGSEVTIARSIEDQKFTGVIRVDRDEAVFFPRLAGLLGVSVHRSQTGWFLSPDHRAYSSNARSVRDSRN